MQVSHSRVDTFKQCPYKWKLSYIDNLTTLPDDAPDNALYLGTALHAGLEGEDPVQNYFSNYHIITDEIVEESMKLEVMVQKAKKMIPAGMNEVPVITSHFKGFIDLLVPVSENGILKEFDLYDFKYSNNKQNYVDSDQLHLYKYFYEKINPLHTIRNMYFLLVPKLKLKKTYGEDPIQFRKKVMNELQKLEPELMPVKYDPTKVVQFLLETKEMIECKSYEKKDSFLCGYCEFKDYCKKGRNYMLLPKNERRKKNVISKRKIWLFGSPFSGKTTFANAFPDCLMLNSDGNIEFVDAPYVAIRDEVKMNGRITERTWAWDIFKDAVFELEKKDNEFKTIVVDLLEDVYEACRRKVCFDRGWDHESDDSFKAYDIVRTEFLTVIKRLMNLDYENIILISHVDTTKDITKRSGDKITSIKPNLNDKIANKIAGMVDIVGRTIAEDGKYILSFKRSEVIFGGGRLPFTEDEIPLDYDAFCRLYDAVASKKFPSDVPSEETEKVTESETEEVSVLKDTTYYKTSDGNFVKKNAGDVPLHDAIVITEDEFKEGVKAFATQTNEETPKRRTRRTRA